MLWTTLCLIFKEPIVAYGCSQSFLANAAMASFWTTLTALLGTTPYNYPPLAIGLFSLVALGPVFLIPLYAHFVVDRFVTLVAAATGLAIGIIGTAVGASTGKLSIAGIIVQALSTDFGVDSASVAYRTAIYTAQPKARNRTNVAYTACSFAGQMMGTSVGNTLYAIGGWTNVGILNICLLVGALLIVTLRGPREEGWFGWKGGFTFRAKSGVN